MNDLYRKSIEHRKSLLDQVKTHPSLFQAIDWMLEALKKGNKILTFGNGGSATQASHFAAEMVNKFYLKREPFPALSLVDNCGNITSIANDFNFREVFSKQIKALGKTGDIALGLTTSGTSENVLEALKTAKAGGLKTIALCGRNTHDLKATGIDLIVAVNSSDTPAIQEIHLFMLHTMAERLEAELSGGTRSHGD